MERSYKIPSKTCSDKKRQAFWSQVLSDQINSGMSMVEFCKLHGLKYSTLKNYKYSKRHIKTVTTPRIAGNPPRIAGNPVDAVSDTINTANDTAYGITQPEISKFIPLQIDHLSAADITDQICHSNQTGRPTEENKSLATELKIVFKNGHFLVLPSTIVEQISLPVIVKTVAGL